RALNALLRGDPEGCESALDELTLTPTRDAPIDAAGVLAIRARLWLDDTAGARRAHETAVREGHTALEYGEAMLAALLASTLYVEGDLSEAEYQAEDTLKRAEKYGLENHPMVFEALWTRGQVAYERALFDQAETAFERSIAVSDRVRLPFVLLGQVGL